MCAVDNLLEFVPGFQALKGVTFLDEAVLHKQEDPLRKQARPASSREREGKSVPSPRALMRALDAHSPAATAATIRALTPSDSKCRVQDPP